MPVYIDTMQIKFRHMRMSHMIADTLEELHAMATEIGMLRDWFQGDASFPHYDVCKMRKAKAVQLGAIVLERREFVAKIRYLRAKHSEYGRPKK